MRWRRNPTRVVDVIGGLVCGALALAAVWKVTLEPGTAVAELSRMRQVLAETTEELLALETERDRQDALLVECRARMQRLGVLPEKVPLEEELRVLAQQVWRDDLHVMKVTPRDTVTYPGAEEVRYQIVGSVAYEVFPEVLRRFEACSFWGDITYWRILAGGTAPTGARKDRVVEMTVSFYSAGPGAPSDASPGR